MLHTCSYCNREAIYQLKNGKWCCQTSPNKCPDIRKKNSSGLKTAYSDGTFPLATRVFSDDARLRMGASNKGKTKYTCEHIRIQSEKLSKTWADHPEKNTGAYKPGVRQDDTVYKKQSDTRKSRYLSGELTPAFGVGRGKYSYIIYNGSKICLRSTYEFIYAIHLKLNNIPFTMESVRVKNVTEYKNRNSFISDFLINGNQIVEIKGIPSGKDKYARESFEAAGYQYIILYDSEIQKIKNDLIERGINIVDLIQSIVLGHESKNYLVYNLDTMTIDSQQDARNA